MKWILLYQQRTGHLAQWTAMNNSARRGAIDGKERRGEERRGGKVEPRWEARGGGKREGATGQRVGVCQDVSSRGGETQEKNNLDQTCWVNSEREAASVCVCVCVCVFLTIQKPLCAALCRCLCTNTLGRPSRARLCCLPLSSLHPHCSVSLLKLVETPFTL